MTTTNQVDESHSITKQKFIEVFAGGKRYRFDEEGNLVAIVLPYIEEIDDAK